MDTDGLEDVGQSGLAICTRDESGTFVWLGQTQGMDSKKRQQWV